VGEESVFGGKNLSIKRRKYMVQAFLVVMAFFVMGLVGCGSSPEKRAAEADAEIAEEKVNIMKKYSECLEKYEGKKDVSEKCAPYKEASETFISK
jgi:hypothetical protein